MKIAKLLDKLFGIHSPSRALDEAVRNGIEKMNNEARLLIDADECFRLAGVEHNVCKDCIEHKIREDCLGCPMLYIKEALADTPTIDAEPVDEVIKKIADVLTDTCCPEWDGCPKREQGETCYNHWVDYLQRVVAK